MYKIIIFLGVIFVSCNRSNTFTESKIESEKLSDILCDLHFLSTAKSIGFLNAKDTLEMKKLRSAILFEHDCTEADLMQSIAYYSHKPDSLSAIYTRMINKISVKQAQMH